MEKKFNALIRSLALVSKNVLSDLIEFNCFYRLQYFARGLQVYIRQLRVALQGKTGDALKTEEVINTYYSAKVTSVLAVCKQK